jgi:hypothetical protein
VVLVLLPPAVGRAIDRAMGLRDRGSILLNTRGTWGVCALGWLVARVCDDFAVVARLIYQMLLTMMSAGR